MKKTVVIHQPDFLPYLGFFHRLLYADLFIILDDVQFLRKGGWHHRDRIKTKDGAKWITLNVKKANLKAKINEITLNNEDGRDKKHLSLIYHSYHKSQFFNEVYPLIKNLYNEKYDNLIEINLASIKLLLKLFDIKVNIEFSSQYEISTYSNQRLVELLQKVQATHYLSGIGTKDYFEPKPYKDASIEVIWQKFDHPIYPQLHGEFIPNLSSIDMLFNCGIEKSREILRSI